MAVKRFRARRPASWRPRERDRVSPQPRRHVGKSGCVAPCVGLTRTPAASSAPSQPSVDLTRLPSATAGDTTAGARVTEERRREWCARPGKSARPSGKTRPEDSSKPTSKHSVAERLRRIPACSDDGDGQDGSVRIRGASDDSPGTSRRKDLPIGGRHHPAPARGRRPTERPRTCGESVGAWGEVRWTGRLGSMLTASDAVSRVGRTDVSNSRSPGLQHAPARSEWFTINDGA